MIFITTCCALLKIFIQWYLVWLMCMKWAFLTLLVVWTRISKDGTFQSFLHCEITKHNWKFKMCKFNVKFCHLWQHQLRSYLTIANSPSSLDLSSNHDVWRQFDFKPLTFQRNEEALNKYYNFQQHLVNM